MKKLPSFEKRAAEDFDLASRDDKGGNSNLK